MPPKRRKFESTFPAARIKKIMQLDDDVGRVASSVPVVISRAVEIFLQALLTRSADYAHSRNAKTLTVGHLKHCIEQEKQWDFLTEITAKISDVVAQEDDEEATAPKRGRKRKGSPAVPVAHTLIRRRRKQRVGGREGDWTGSSEEEGVAPSTSAVVVGGARSGPFSQYFNRPSPSAGQSRSSLLAVSRQQASSSSSLNHTPSLLSSASLPSLSVATPGAAALHQPEEEEEDYDV